MPIAHPRKETKFRSRISDNINLIVEMKRSKNRFNKTRTLTGMLNDRDTLRIEWTRFQSDMHEKLSLQKHGTTGNSHYA